MSMALTDCQKVRFLVTWCQNKRKQFGQTVFCKKLIRVLAKTMVSYYEVAKNIFMKSYDYKRRMNLSIVDEVSIGAIINVVEVERLDAHI